MMKNVEKDVVLKKEKVDLGKFVSERIEENNNLFTKEELEYIDKNKTCIEKVYFLGFSNARNCYK